MEGIRTVGLLGGGVIGAGWAARALLNGLDAVVCDPDPEAERKLGEVVANARRAWSRLTLAPLPEPGRLTLVRHVEEAAEGADFIQESLPEREDLKRTLLARAEAMARPDVIIASSTSGLLPTRLQAGLRHPERFTVGHPFNPVYLMPLVEVCGGGQTSAETTQRAAALYQALGMRPLVLQREVDAFIADRLMEALWREALWLVHDGIATAEEIDDAMRFGPGLRWAFMGTFLIYRIAGGEPGMRHFMAQFGPSLKWPWTKLMDVPDLDDALLDRIVAQSDAQARGEAIRDLERKRDDCLVAVLQGLRAQDYAAGAVLKAYEERLYPSHGAVSAAPEAKPDAPLLLHRARVEPGWVDYNAHMTESRYLQVFGDTTDALLAHIGMDAAYLAGGHSWYTVETHLRHLRELAEGEALHVTTQLLAADEKRLHVFHALYRSTDSALCATAEHMLLHVDTRAGRACPAEPAQRERIARILAAHAELARPEAAGRRVGLA